MIRTIQATGLMLALLGSVSIGNAQDTLEQKIRTLAKPYLDAQQVTSLSIGVIKDGKQSTVHLSETEKPNDATIYEIGSISKVFTGLLLADSVARGGMKLDDEASKYLPSNVVMPKFEGQAITLKQLSTHTSGLPRLGNNMPSLGSDNPYADYTSKLAFEFLNSHKLQRAPGTKKEYSNFAVALLGDLVCRHNKMTYDQLLADRITKPLGMSSTSVSLNAQQRKHLATPHLSSLEPTKNWDFADTPGAGGIRSNIVDMLRFAKANLDRPDGEIGDALKLAWQQQHPRSGTQHAMGLGWHIAFDGSTRWHNGQTGGYHSMMLINRQASVASILLTNTAAKEAGGLAEQIVRVLLGIDERPRTFKKYADVSKAQMQRLVGKYMLNPFFIFDVIVKGDRLMIGITNQQTQRVYPLSATEWEYQVVDAKLTFKFNKDNKCESLELFQNGIRQTAKRIPDTK